MQAPDLGKTESLPLPAPLTPAQSALRDIIARMDVADLTSEERVALGLNLVAHLASDLPFVKGSRGKVINALKEELGKRLQKVLPLIL